MRIKLLTFRYSATLGGFDDTALVDFTRDKEVIAFREHFYLVNEVPHLSCVVHYQDAVVPQAALDAAREIAPRAQQAQEPRFQRRDGAPDPRQLGASATRARAMVSGPERARCARACTTRVASAGTRRRCAPPR